MAITVMLNPAIVINSVDLSSWITQAKLDITYDEVDTTAFGGGGAKTRIAGLSDAKLTIDFQQDYVPSAVEQTIFPLVGGTTTFSIQPLEGAVTTQNPNFSGVILLTQWMPVGGKVGELETVSVTWPVTGLVSKST